MPQLSELTAIVLTRHGHGTAGLVVDELRQQSLSPERIIYADISSPASVADYLADDAELYHLRFDEPVSRQQARRRALQEVDSEFALLIDNNMTLGDGAIETLMAAAADTGAALVSPLIVTHGGALHYSGGVIKHHRSLRKLGKQVAARPQDAIAPALTPISEVRAQRTDIDFVESHCAIARTDALRRPGVLVESMHNAHTMCFAGHKLRRVFKERVVLEPDAVASIVPYSLGYDLPWMCLEYMRRDRLALAYRNLSSAIGSGPDTDLAACLPWHAMHFKYLLLGMLEADRWDRDALVSEGDLPPAMAGYDLPLPLDVDQQLRQELVPRIADRFPELVAPVEQWLDIDHLARSA